ncbi:Thiol-disulfide oxidoreductase ResA [compost metagenome]
MKNHLRAAAVVVGIVIIGFVVFLQYSKRSANSDAPTTVDMQTKMETEGVENFSAETLDKQKFELASMKGKLVILNFWASWCGPCIEEVPSLIKLVKEFKGEVQLIAVSGDSSEKDIEIFLKSFPEFKNENIKIVWDQDRSLMKKFGINRLPESMILSKDQKLIKRIIGSIEWYNEDSKTYVKNVLAK